MFKAMTQILQILLMVPYLLARLKTMSILLILQELTAKFGPQMEMVQVLGQLQQDLLDLGPLLIQKILLLLEL